MIHGVRATTVIFKDLQSVTPTLGAQLAGRFAGIHGVGHQVRLGEQSFRVWAGNPQSKGKAIACSLQLGPIDNIELPKVEGELRFEPGPSGGRTKVTIEGSCARTASGLPPSVGRDQVLRIANEHCRLLLGILASAIEDIAQGH